MKLVRHYENVIAIFERAWEKAYLLARQGTEEWVPLYLPDQAQPQLCAEMHSVTHVVRLCGDHLVQTEQRVLFHDIDLAQQISGAGEDHHLQRSRKKPGMHGKNASLEAAQQEHHRSQDDTDK